jgi:hypothetical protein
MERRPGMMKTWLVGSALLAVTVAPVSASSIHQDGQPGVVTSTHDHGPENFGAAKVDLGPDNFQAKHTITLALAGDPDGGGEQIVAL